MENINKLFFFFSSRRRHTRCSRDWSSDVCSSDLPGLGLRQAQHRALTALPEPHRETSEEPARHVDQVAERLRRHRARGAAIAIAGPPGAGKTRIAADVAAAV